jgi:hypothetical protein
MKHVIQIFGLLLVLNACTVPVETDAQTTNNTVKNCPKSAVVSLPEMQFAVIWSY